MAEWWEVVLAGLAGGSLPAIVAALSIRNEVKSSTQDRQSQRDLLTATQRHERELQWRVRAAEAYSNALTLLDVLPHIIDSFSSDMGRDALAGLATRSGDVVKEMYILQAMGGGTVAKEAGRCADAFRSGTSALYQVAARALTDRDNVTRHLQHGREVVMTLRGDLMEPLEALRLSIAGGEVSEAAR